MTNSMYPLKSHMDDTRLYSRVLSPSEILALYTLPGLKSSVVENTFKSIDNSEIVIYPNPFSDHFTIHAGKIIEDIKIYTLLGLEIRSYRNMNSDLFVIEKIEEAGSAFIVKVTTRDGNIHIMKVFKKR
jgi:hypothetical protein